MSEEIANEVMRWYAEQDRVVPPNLEDFIDRHGGGRPVQLPLPLRGAA
jgi:hypothetical protein